MIPLALAAWDAGYDVLFATDQSFHANLKAFGLPAVDAGLSVHQAFVEAAGRDLDPAPVRPELAGAVCGAVLPRSFSTDLEPVFAAAKPDFVVHEAGNPGALFATRLAGIPGVCHGFGRIAKNNLDKPIFIQQAARAEEVGIELTDEVTRGGGGTTLGALATGARQLVLPQGADQFSNADAVETGRAGGVLRGDEQAAGNVARLVKQVLTDDENPRRRADSRRDRCHAAPGGHRRRARRHRFASAVVMPDGDAAGGP